MDRGLNNWQRIICSAQLTSSWRSQWRRSWWKPGPSSTPSSGPRQAFRAVGKLSKPIWLIILGVAFVVGLYAAAYGGVVGFLSVAAFVAAAIYLADMRPKLKEFGRGNSRSNSGPYGPW